MAVSDLLRLLWSRFVAARLLDRFLMLVVVLGILGLLSMRSPRPPILPRPTTGHARAWFDCFDCRQGELDSLRALVGRSPGTVAVLGRVLSEGPGAGDTAAYASGLRLTHARTSAWLAGHDTTIRLGPMDAYVSERLRIFDRSWRVRAAYVLGSLVRHPPSAVALPFSAAALDSACADASQHDRSVLRAVIWARMAGDTLASPGCLARAHAVGLPALGPQGYY